MTYAIKSDWQTVTENKQIQQSVTLVFLDRLGVPVSFLLVLPLVLGASPPRALSCRRAFVLYC